MGGSKKNKRINPNCWKVATKRHFARNNFANCQTVLSLSYVRCRSCCSVVSHTVNENAA